MNIDEWYELTENEIWRDIPNFESEYQASTFGRIRSKTRLVFNRGNYKQKAFYQPIKGRLLKGHRTKLGHTVVELSGGKRFFIHQLVLLAFVGPCPPGMESRHLNGDSTNDRLDNLAYGTPTQNNHDRIRHGTIIRGEQVNTNKLTRKQVLYIRKHCIPLPCGQPRKGIDTSKSLSGMARKFGVKPSSIKAIINKQNWNWL